MIGTEITAASHWLTQGEVVAIPTETVYGLAANALNEDAVLKIYTVKNRPTFNPLIVHVSSIAEFDKYAHSIPSVVFDLAKHFSPGPLTYILPKKSIIPDLVTAGHDSVALRIPAHPLTLQLLQTLDFPLAAPSANPFGYISPTQATHVEDQLGGQVKYILDGGNCEVGVESTIVSFLENEPLLLRFGGADPEEIKKITGSLNIAKPTENTNPIAPGMLSSHYAPSIPLYFGEVDDLMQDQDENEVAIINFCEKKNRYARATQWVLSPSMSTQEAAKNLFALLRVLDKQHYKKIIAEPAPNTGLGLAINDRLRRAAFRNW